MRLEHDCVHIWEAYGSWLTFCCPCVPAGLPRARAPRWQVQECCGGLQASNSTEGKLCFLAAAAWRTTTQSNHSSRTAPAAAHKQESSWQWSTWQQQAEQLQGRQVLAVAVALHTLTTHLER